jgi:hypothetical protein
MSGHSRKRAAEFNTKESTSKRPNTTSSGDVDITLLDSSDEDEDERIISKLNDTKAINSPATYLIAVQLHSDYDIFPEYIRKSLESMYRATIQSTMTSLSDKKLPKYDQNFSIISKRSVRDVVGVEPKITICKDNIVRLSVANTALLEIFLATWKQALARPSFVYLKKKDGLANPAFSRLHMVRHGDIGWGFDTNSCLSLFVPTLEGDKLKEYVIYVQRTETKTPKLEKHDD